MASKKRLKVFNGYGGMGGNRRLWDGCDVTMVEQQQNIADDYKRRNPDDVVIVGDARQYLLDHYEEFDFVWMSPPCQRNTKMIRSGRNRKPAFPDLRMYEEVIFLQFNYKGLWVVENVIPYFEPLMPAKKLGRHLFWSNFDIDDMDNEPHFKNFANWQNVSAKKALQDWLGIHYEGNIYYGNNHCVTQVLRNCVHPDVGLHVFNCMKKVISITS